MIDTIPVGSGPGVELNPLTNRLYVAHFNDDTVSVIDTTTNTVLDTIGVGSFPAGLAVNPIANIVYVSNRFEDTVSVIDGNTNTVIDTIPVGFYPGNPDFDPVTDRWYLPIRFDGLWIFDGTDNSLVIKIKPSDENEFSNVAVDSLRNRVFVTDIANRSVLVLDGASYSVIDNVPIDEALTGGLAVNPWKNRIYAGHEGEDTLSVIGQAVETIYIDIKPYNSKNTINPRSRGGIWVALLSDREFDPLRVDIRTVRFGRHKAKAIRHRVRDINRDGVADLMLRFKVRHTGIRCGDTKARLKAKTYFGERVVGSDSIKTVGRKCGK